MPLTCTHKTLPIALLRSPCPLRARYAPKFRIIHIDKHSDLFLHCIFLSPFAPLAFPFPLLLLRCLGAVESIIGKRSLLRTRSTRSTRSTRPPAHQGRPGFTRSAEQHRTRPPSDTPRGRDGGRRQCRSHGPQRPGCSAGDRAAARRV